jgi:Ca-activated chloride channel family protein
VVPLPSDHGTVVLAMDVSLSMRATDVQPNRLVAAQEAAKAFLAELPRNVRVAIVTFAGTAQLVQPATLNREDLVAAIDRFQMQRGTAVGSGIVVALQELFPDEGIDLSEMIYGSGQKRGRSIDDEKTEEKPKKEFVPVAPGSYESAAIVLLTDGRQTTGVNTQEAAKMAADHGVRVYSVGLGTVSGEVQGFEGWSMYLRLDEPSLKAVALATQGEYYYAGNAADLRKVYEKLGTRLQVDKKETEISALLALVAAVLAIGAASLSLLWFNRIL